jgi:phospholipase/carboxylesterase
VVTPRGPLKVPGWTGNHRYVVPRVGYPDPETFYNAYESLAAFHDELWAATGIAPERTIFGGFSMGSVMSYSLGLAGERPVPAGILAFSGFIPTVEGWQPDLGSPIRPACLYRPRPTRPADGGPLARGARELLEAGGLPVSYHESDAADHIDPAHLPAAVEWVASVTRAVGAR